MGDTRDSGAGSPGSAWPERLARYREKLLENAILLLPGAVLTAAAGYLSHLLFDQPWRAVFVLGPLALLAALLWRRLGGPTPAGEIAVGRRSGAFLAVYLVVFGVAAGSDVLVWKRELVGFEESVPRNWLGLNWLGDWRYWVITRQRPSSGLLILTTNHPLSRAQARAEVGQLIGLAKANGARGIAFDFYFTQPSELDTWLCAKVRGAGIPVFTGFGFGRHNGTVFRLPYPSSLESCLPQNSVQGHLMGYREADHLVRSIPLSFKDMPALSWRIANQLMLSEHRASPPNTGLLRFLPTSTPIASIPLDTLYKDRDLVNVLRDQFVLVGEGKGSADTVPTPFGTMAGVAVHALAVQALMNERVATDAPWWASLAFLLVSCYIVTLIVSRRESVAQVMLVTAGVSVAMALAAAAAARFWLVWVDVSYAVIGTWLLMALMLTIRRASRPHPGASSRASAST